MTNRGSGGISCQGKSSARLYRPVPRSLTWTAIRLMGVKGSISLRRRAAAPAAFALPSVKYAMTK